MFNRRPELFWLLLVCSILLLAVWWIPGSGSLDSDSYSVAYSGKKVIYQSMKQLKGNVYRSTDQLVPDEAVGDGQILILGPARYPTDEEWELLYDMVISGGSVVFAARTNDPFLDAGPFGVSVVGRGTGDQSSEQPEDAELDDDAGEGELKEEDLDDFEIADSVFANPFESPKATSRLVSMPVKWRSSGVIETDSDDWEVLVETDGIPQAVTSYVGLGDFTMIASDEIFNNGAVIDSNCALLAWRLLEYTGTDRVTYFDESLNSSGVPKVIGLLFDPRIRPITLQLILVAVLFGWLGCRRFGPARQSNHGRRRSVVEHAQAVGTLYYQAGTGHHAVKRLREFLNLELRSRYGQGFQVNDPVRVAQQAQADPEQVKQLFNEIRGFSGSARQSNAAAGRLLRGLANLLAGIRERTPDSNEATK